MRFLDCFAGIGGFRLGMEQAGHTCVGHIEIDRFANTSYKAIHNPKKDEYFGTDITTIDPRELPDFDILCGGFPCQAFSIAGKRRGFEDTRGTLFFDLARIIAEKRPIYIFLENVRGLLNHDKGRTFSIILLTLSELGYDVEWQLLNSKNFGVPQSRERVFIVGHLRGRSGRAIFPLRHNERVSAETSNTDEPQSQAQHISTTIKPKCGSRADDTFIAILQSPRGRNRGGLHKIAPTITSQSYEHNNRLLLDGRLRRLTPLECFRLQGFPDWAFERAKSAGVSDTQLYKQAGNSVTVSVVYEIAKNF